MKKIQSEVDENLIRPFTINKVGEDPNENSNLEQKKNIFNEMKRLK